MPALAVAPAAGSTPAATVPAGPTAVNLLSDTPAGAVPAAVEDVTEPVSLSPAPAAPPTVPLCLSAPLPVPQLPACVHGTYAPAASDMHACGTVSERQVSTWQISCAP